MSRLANPALRQEVVDALVDNGYSLLPSPLSLGDITLDMDSVFSGPANSLDLVVIADRPDGREERLRLYWQIQRLVRALDASDSRRTITLVVIGDIEDAKLMADLQTVARVLPVDTSLPTRRFIAPLLELRLPGGMQVSMDGIEQVRSTIKGPDRSSLLELARLASSGPEAVKAGYLAWVDASLRAGRKSDDDG